MTSIEEYIKIFLEVSKIIKINIVEKIKSLKHFIVNNEIEHVEVKGKFKLQSCFFNSFYIIKRIVEIFEDVVKNMLLDDIDYEKLRFNCKNVSLFFERLKFLDTQENVFIDVDEIYNNLKDMEIVLNMLENQIVKLISLENTKR